MKSHKQRVLEYIEFTDGPEMHTMTVLKSWYLALLWALAYPFLAIINFTGITLLLLSIDYTKISTISEFLGVFFYLFISALIISLIDVGLTSLSIAYYRRNI